MLNLTDMWRAAGKPKEKQPADWRSSKSGKEFIEHIMGTTGKNGSEVFQVVNGGLNPGTWAHWQIGLAYAGRHHNFEKVTLRFIKILQCVRYDFSHKTLKT